MTRDHDPPDRRDERLADYREGRMSPDQRRAFEAEVLEDDALAEALYADMNLETLVRQPGPTGRVTPTGRIARSWRWVLPLAAGVALVFAVPQLVRQGSEEPRMRGEDAPVRLVSPVGDVAEFPRRYVWTRDPEAVQYRFELYDSETRRIFQALVADTLLDLPEGAVASPGPRSGSWRVVPVDRSGFERSGASPAFFRAPGH